MAWLGGVSVQAALLIVAILAVHRLAGRGIPAHWRHALWVLVLLRLFLPWTPESRFSVYGLLPDAWRLSGWGGGVPAALPDAGLGGIGGAGVAALARGGVVAGAGGGLRSALALVWVTGAAATGGWFLLQAVTAMLAFRGRRPVTDEAILELLEDCKEELGVHTYLAVVETPDVRVPALFGWIRPRLALPEGVLSTLEPGELRHVFLHELAHLKRRDIAFNWLAAVAQTLHWFNPAVWLAGRQARADMELACDELALSRVGEREARDYGLTIIKLLDASARPFRLPQMATISEDAAQVKRRIQMIAIFKKEGAGSRALAAMALLALGVVFLVDPHGVRAGKAQSLEPGPVAVAGAAGTAQGAEKPMGDAAMESAAKWMALVDAGQCGQAWETMHSYVHTLLSQEAWGKVCGEITRLETAEHGKLLSRKPLQVEVLAELPLNLGQGISVGFLSQYEKGEFAGPKVLLAKDKDGEWRMVRADKQ